MVKIGKIKDLALKNMPKKKLKKLIQEAEAAITVLADSMDSFGIRRRRHNVSVDGINHTVFDAVVPNRFANQSGRGCYRHGIASNQYALFKELDNGNYKRITAYTTILWR